METSGRPLIVVGVDGSAASKEALRWAARQAELTGADLRVITAWRRPATYGVPADYSDADFEKEARETLDAMIGEILGPTSKLSVDARVEEGHPAPLLVAAARDADLLVVGSHGRGAFAEMLLGSTTQHCVHHAHCPVLVIRHQETA